jgi:B-box zinc finger
VEQKTGDLCEICVCDDKNVCEMFCLQCEQSYCESCSNAHLKMNVSNSHKLVRLDELQSGVNVKKKYRPQYCDKHSEELIKMYCLDDEVAICTMCCVHAHRSHRCVEVKNIANQFRTGKWKPNLQTALSKVEEELEILHSKKLSFFDKIKVLKMRFVRKLIGRYI